MTENTLSENEFDNLSNYFATLGESYHLSSIIQKNIDASNDAASFINRICNILDCNFLNKNCNVIPFFSTSGQFSKIMVNKVKLFFIYNLLHQQYLKDNGAFNNSNWNFAISKDLPILRFFLDIDCIHCKNGLEHTSTEAIWTNFIKEIVTFFEQYVSCGNFINLNITMKPNRLYCGTHLYFDLNMDIATRYLLLDKMILHFANHEQYVIDATTNIPMPLSRDHVLFYFWNRIENRAEVIENMAFEQFCDFIPYNILDLGNVYTLEPVSPYGLDATNTLFKYELMSMQSHVKTLLFTLSSEIQINTRPYTYDDYAYNGIMFNPTMNEDGARGFLMDELKQQMNFKAIPENIYIDNTDDREHYQNKFKSIPIENRSNDTDSILMDVDLSETPSENYDCLESGFDSVDMTKLELNDMKNLNPLVIKGPPASLYIPYSTQDYKTLEIIASQRPLTKTYHEIAAVFRAIPLSLYVLMNQKMRYDVILNEGEPGPTLLDINSKRGVATEFNSVYEDFWLSLSQTVAPIMDDYIADFKKRKVEKKNKKRKLADIDVVAGTFSFETIDALPFPKDYFFSGLIQYAIQKDYITATIGFISKNSNISLDEIVRFVFWEYREALTPKGFFILAKLFSLVDGGIATSFDLYNGNPFPYIVFSSLFTDSGVKNLLNSCMTFFNKVQVKPNDRDILFFVHDYIWRLQRIGSEFVAFNGISWSNISINEITKCVSEILSIDFAPNIDRPIHEFIAKPLVLGYQHFTSFGEFNALWPVYEPATPTMHSLLRRNLISMANLDISLLSINESQYRFTEQLYFKIPTFLDYISMNTFSFKMLAPIYSPKTPFSLIMKNVPDFKITDSNLTIQHLNSSKRQNGIDCWTKDFSNDVFTSKNEIFSTALSLFTGYILTIANSFSNINWRSPSGFLIKLFSERPEKLAGGYLLQVNPDGGIEVCKYATNLNGGSIPSILSDISLENAKQDERLPSNSIFFKDLRKALETIHLDDYVKEEDLTNGNLLTAINDKILDCVYKKRAMRVLSSPYKIISIFKTYVPGVNHKINLKTLDETMERFIVMTFSWIIRMGDIHPLIDTKLFNYISTHRVAIYEEFSKIVLRHYPMHKINNTQDLAIILEEFDKRNSLVIEPEYYKPPFDFASPPDDYFLPQLRHLKQSNNDYPENIKKAIYYVFAYFIIAGNYKEYLFTEIIKMWGSLAYPGNFSKIVQLLYGSSNSGKSLLITHMFQAFDVGILGNLQNRFSGGGKNMQENNCNAVPLSHSFVVLLDEANSEVNTSAIKTHANILLTTSRGMNKNEVSKYPIAAKFIITSNNIVKPSELDDDGWNSRIYPLRFTFSYASIVPKICMFSLKSESIRSNTVANLGFQLLNELYPKCPLMSHVPEILGSFCTSFLAKLLYFQVAQPISKTMTPVIQMEYQRYLINHSPWHALRCGIRIEPSDIALKRTDIENFIETWLNSHKNISKNHLHNLTSELLTEISSYKSDDGYRVTLNNLQT